MGFVDFLMISLFGRGIIGKNRQALINVWNIKKQNLKGFELTRNKIFKQAARFSYFLK